jgi:hypothetical protein
MHLVKYFSLFNMATFVTCAHTLACAEEMDCSCWHVVTSSGAGTGTRLGSYAEAAVSFYVAFVIFFYASITVTEHHDNPVTKTHLLALIPDL